MKTKNIKVAYTNRYSKNCSIPHSGAAMSATVPKIQMEGRWLESLGFTIGAPLIVEYEEGSIHIRTLTAEEMAEKERGEAQAEFEKKLAELEQARNRMDSMAAPSMVAEPAVEYAASAAKSRY